VFLVICQDRWGDSLLLGMEWAGSMFVDTALPFGLPKSSQPWADALEWVVKSDRVTSVLHYLDDYLLVDKTEKRCQEALKTLLQECLVS